MRQVQVIDHRRDRREPIRVVRVRATDALRHWRDTDPGTSEIARYPWSWHDVEQDPENGDWVVRKLEAQRDPRDVRDSMTMPPMSGLKQSGAQEYDPARDLCGRTGDAKADVERIRQRDRRQRTSDGATLKQMNAAARKLWAGRV